MSNQALRVNEFTRQNHKWMGLFFCVCLELIQSDELKTGLYWMHYADVSWCVRLVKSNFHVYSSALEHVCLACPDSDMKHMITKGWQCVGDRTGDMHHSYGDEWRPLLCDCVPLKSLPHRTPVSQLIVSICIWIGQSCMQLYITYTKHKERYICYNVTNG